MIQVENISRSFGTFKAVDSISFSIETGEIVGLLGPNGAGKTTTMRMITGFIEQDSGSIKIDGVDIRDNPKEAKRKIGYMSESAPLYSDMIVADYLEYCAEMHDVDGKERVPHLASVCGLNDVMHKKISELSRGYKQRVGLAHALMNDPEILILDEPTSGLDPNQIIEVRALIKEIGKTRTVIISTHILSEVEMLCDRVIIISKGTIVADSPTQELQSRYAQKSILKVQLTDYQSAQDVKDGLSKIEGILSIANSEIHDEKLGKILKLELSIDDGAEIRGKIAREIIEKNLGSLIELNLEKNTLEDVFKSLTSEGESDEN
ncbi:MAG: ATP-binding cassette domain-containing protein [Treponemataceae bacterium]|nr:ATP-binding cassette domain-containing protein [Spirochaetales bacterium]MDY6031219.1 ATP-binding cassette domain-containing protein [Treponemataceae bacterium]